MIYSDDSLQLAKVW